MLLYVRVAVVDVGIADAALMMQLGCDGGMVLIPLVIRVC